MFNLVAGVIMIGIGAVCVARAALGKGTMAVGIFFGVTMIIFGITQMIRSKKVRENKKKAKSREMDMYMMLAQSKGLVVNPITGEIVKKPEGESAAEESEEAETDVAEADAAKADVAETDTFETDAVEVALEDEKMVEEAAEK